MELKVILRAEQGYSFTDDEETTRGVVLTLQVNGWIFETWITRKEKRDVQR